jgi:alpha-glucosidase
MKILRLVLAALVVHAALAQSPAGVVAAAKPSSDATWWKHAVIYEIYPRSFDD